MLSPARRLRIDVHAFEAAAAEARRTQTTAAYRAAAELYAGDLLPEDRYEDWEALPRESLRRTYLELVETLASLHDAQGEEAAAIDAWQQIVASEPANEEAHAHLMRLYVPSAVQDVTPDCEQRTLTIRGLAQLSRAAPRTRCSTVRLCHRCADNAPAPIAAHSQRRAHAKDDEHRRPPHHVPVATPSAS